MLKQILIATNSNYFELSTTSKRGKNSKWSCVRATVSFSFILLFLLAALQPSAQSTFAATSNQNILANPSFNSGLTKWEVSDNVTLQNGSALLSVQSDGAVLTTDYFAVTPKQLLTFSLMAKAENILHPSGDRRASISLHTYRSDKSQIRKYVLADFSGTFDWKKMNGEFTTPYGASYMRLSVRLSQTSGALLVDDFMLTLRGEPAINLSGVERYPNDPPTVSRRGAIASAGWFNSSQIMERFQEANFNFAWSQGSYLNQKMQYKWRESFTSSERSTISSWMGKCAANNVDCFMSLGPRGATANDATTYSSNTEINLLVDKFEDLYALGVRNFGLNFDDLRYTNQDELIGSDADRFNNLGQAHYYFTNEIYQRFISTRPDSTLMVVPLYYDLVGNLGSNEEIYLQELGALPAEIEMISTIVFVEDAQAMVRLTGRRHVVWDNQFAYAYEVDGAGEYIAPLYREVLDNTLISGYAFLPLVTTKEDTARISWRTAADYAWAPERYDPIRSFQLAVAKYQGSFEQLPIETSSQPEPTAASTTVTPVPTTAISPTDIPATSTSTVPPTVAATLTAEPTEDSIPMPTNTVIPQVAATPSAFATEAAPIGTVVLARPTATAVAPAVQRVAAGLQVLYTFQEGNGDRIYDRSGSASPLDLIIRDVNAVGWSATGLSVNSPTLISSEESATNIIDACQASQSLTIESWITPANQTQSGPARIITLSQDASSRNFTLGQDGANLEVRVRASSTNQNGMPSSVLGANIVDAEQMHIVYTLDASGASALFVDGVLTVNGSRSGLFTNWNREYKLALANELTVERGWLGVYHLVAVYCQALDANEINQNFAAGFESEINQSGHDSPAIDKNNFPTIYIPLVNR